MSSSDTRFSRVNTVFGRLGLVWLVVANLAIPGRALAETAVVSAASGAPIATPTVTTTSSEAAQPSHSEPSTAAAIAHTDLNLNSVVANLTAGDLVKSTPVNIQVGANTQSITSQTLVTPAQMVAIVQVLASGSQSIVLGDAGNAVGGTLHLGDFATNFRDVVIPENVTAIRDFGRSSTMALSGSLTNFGTLYAISSNSAVSAATIAAVNIYNQPGALLTSVLPSAGLSGYSNLVSNLNLNLYAVNDIVNAGRITSAGNLTAAAGGSIINALPTGVTGAQPIMSALQSINLMSTVGSITNSGVIAATAGNLNLSSAATQNLLINNIAGTLQALNGSVSVRDVLYTGSAGLEISGGSILAKEINLYNANGSLSANLAEVTGTLNTYGSYAHIAAATDNLTLGTISIKGDPTYFNSAGDITISGNIEVEEKLAIIASGNIVTTSGVSLIQARDAAGQGYDIHLVAGANVSGTGSTIEIAETPPLVGNASGAVTITGTSTTGGRLDFSASPTLHINANSTCLTCNSANVTMVAYASGSSGGQILLPQNSEVNVSGTASSNNGNVTLIAGANQAGAVSITTGKLVAAGGTQAPNTGKIDISVAQPAFSSGTSLTFAPDGSISSGNSFVPAATAANGSVSINNDIIASDRVSMRAGGDIVARYQSIDTVPVEWEPRGTALNRAGTRAYTTNIISGTVSVIDTQTNTVLSTVPVGSIPTGVSVDPNGSFIYVTNQASGTVSVIDAQTNTVVDTIVVGSAPNQIAVDKNGTFAYTANLNTNDVSVIDLSSRTVVATIPVGDGPGGIALNGSGTRAYVANSRGNSVFVIDTEKRAVVHTIGAVMGNPEGIAVSPDGRYLYTANPGNGTVTVFTTEGIPAIVSNINTGGSPFGVTFDSSGTVAYVSNRDTNSLTVINTATRTPITNASTLVGAFPESSSSFAGFVDGHARAYVANRSENTVSVVQLPTIASTNSTISLTSTGGNIFASTAHNAQLGASAKGDVTITAAGNINLENGTAGGSFAVGAKGAVTTFNPISANKISLLAGTSNLTLSGPSATLTATNEILLTSVTGGVTVGGKVTVTATGGTLGIVAAQQLAPLGSLLSANNISLRSTESNIRLDSGIDLTASLTVSLSGRTGITSSGSGRINTASLSLDGGKGTVLISNTFASVLTAVSNGDITINDSASKQVSLRTFESAAGNIQVTATNTGGTLKVDVPMSANEISLEAKSGDVILSTAATISAVNAVTLTALSGKVEIGNSITASAGTGSVSIISSSGISANVSISNGSGGFVTGGLGRVSAPVIQAKSTNSSITINGDITANSSLSLQAHSSITGSGSISTPSLGLTITGPGTIDLTGVNAGSVTASSPGTVKLAGPGAITLQSIIASSVQASSPLSITVSGSVGAASSMTMLTPMLIITTGSSLTGNEISVSRSNSGVTVVNDGSVVATGADIEMTAASGFNLLLQGSGSMSAKGAINFVALSSTNVSNGIYVSGAPTWSAGVTGLTPVVPPGQTSSGAPPTGGTGVTDISGGSINTSSTGGSINTSGTNISLLSNLVINISSLPLAQALSTTSGSISNVSNRGVINPGLSSGVINVLGLTGPVVNPTLLTSGVNFKAGGSNQSLTVQSGSTVAVNSGLAANTPALTLEAGASLSANFVQVFSSKGTGQQKGDSLTVNNAGVLSAKTGDLQLIAATGGDLNVSGGGIMTALAGLNKLTAVESSSNLNKVVFSGNQTFNGSTLIKVSGTSQSLIVQDKVTVTGNNAMTVTSPVIELQGTGRIIGNPLVFVATGVGTIRSRSKVDLANVSNLIFNGQSLAIVSAGDIVNTGGARTIDLSHASKTGGSLTLIAGYKYTAGPFAIDLGTSPALDTTQLTTAENGSIRLGNVSVVTSSSAAERQGGSVLAVARGSVTLGSVTTSAHALSGTAGQVTIVGEGISVGAINTVGFISGAVNLLSGLPAIDTPVVIENGLLSSGSFSVPTFSGNVSVGNIDAGNASISLCTGGSSTFSQQFATALRTTGLLTAVSGTGNIMLNTAAASVALITGGGNASVTSTIAASLASSAVDGTLSFTGAPNLSVAAGSTVAATKGVTIQSTNGVVSFGDGSKVTGGVLKQNAPATPAPLSSADIQQSGAIAVSGTGGISFGANVILTSNGGDVSLTSTKAGSDVTLGAGALLQANGGNLAVSSAGKAILQPAGAAATMVARSVNTYSGGNFNVSGATGVSIGSASSTAGNTMTLSSLFGGVSVGAGVISVGGMTTISGATGVSMGDNVTINSGGNLSISVLGTSGGFTLGNNVRLTAGSLKAGTPAAPAGLAFNDIKQLGSLTVLSLGSGGISGGSGNTLISTGAGLMINSYGLNAAITLGDASTLRAEGGSVTVFGLGPVSIGATGGTGGAVVARAMSGSGMVTISGSNGLFIGDNVTVSSASALFLNNYGTAGAMSIGTGSTLATNGFMFVSSYGAGSTMSFGSNSTVRAGSLIGPYTPPAPLTMNQIGSSGSIFVYGYGKSMTIGNNSIMEANGGSLSLNAFGTAQLQVGDGTQLRANGGMLTIYGSNPVSLGTANGSGVQISASSLSGGGGFINITGSNGLLLGANSRIFAAGMLLMFNFGTTGTLSVGNGSVVTSNGYMNIMNTGSGDLQLGNNVQVGVNNGFLFISKYTPGNTTVGDGSSLSATNGGISVYALGSTIIGAPGGSGVSLSATGANGMISLTGTNGLLIGGGSNVVAGSLAFLNNFGTSGVLRVDNGATVKGGLGVMLASYGATSSVQIGAGAKVIAGSLAQGAPAYPAALSWTHLQQSGAVSIMAFGNNSSNVGIAIENGASVIAHGGGVSISSYAQSGDISIGDGYTISAYGGGISINSYSNRSSALSIGVSGGNTAGSNLVAQGFNGYGAMVSVSGFGGIRFGSGTLAVAGSLTMFSLNSTTLDGLVINGLQTASIMSPGGINVIGSANINAAGNLSLSSTGIGSVIQIGDNVQLSAGKLQAGTLATGVLQTAQIASSGTLSLSAASIAVRDSVKLTSNGGDVVVSGTSGPLTIGNNGIFAANGGNVAMLSSGTVTGGANNYFYARAVGGTYATSGGGIQVSSGFAYPNIAGSFFAAPNTNPATGALGSGVGYAGNQGGIIKANTTGGGTINLNAGGSGPSLLLLNRGAQIFDAQGAGARINIDHATFQTEALRPIGMITEVHGSEDLRTAGRAVTIERDDVVSNSEDEVRGSNVTSSGSDIEVRGSNVAVRGSNVARSGSVRIRVRHRIAEFSVVNQGTNSSVIRLRDIGYLPDCGNERARIHASSWSEFTHRPGGEITLLSGELFLDTKAPIALKTCHATVNARKGALVTATVAHGSTYVRMLSGIGSVQVAIADQVLTLMPGEELAICDQPPAEQLHPTDGVGRRRSTTQQIGGKFATISDIAIVTMFSASAPLTSLAQSKNLEHKQTVARILKTAATIDVVLKHRGAYKAY